MCNVKIYHLLNLNVNVDSKRVKVRFYIDNVEVKGKYGAINL